MERKRKSRAFGSPAYNPFLQQRDKRKFSNIKSFPQERLYWTAYRESWLRYQYDPSPANFLNAQVMADIWRVTFNKEVCNG